MAFENASIITIGDGEAVKKFDFELRKAIEDIGDPNTVATAERTIELKVKLKASEDRKEVAIQFSAKSKLPGDAPSSAHMVIHRGKGHVNNERQLLIDDLEKDVTDITEKEGTNND